jgi:hypothetical protein
VACERGGNGAALTAASDELARALLCHLVMSRGERTTPAQFGGEPIESAMLRDVIDRYGDAVMSDDAESRAFVDAVDRWVSAPAAPWTFSFRRVCAVSEVDPRRVRRTLQRIRMRADGELSDRTASTG